MGLKRVLDNIISFFRLFLKYLFSKEVQIVEICRKLVQLRVTLESAILIKYNFQNTEGTFLISLTNTRSLSTFILCTEHRKQLVFMIWVILQYLSKTDITPPINCARRADRKIMRIDYARETQYTIMFFSRKRSPNCGCENK